MSLKVSDDDFIATWQRFKDGEKVAKILGLSIRQVYYRRRNLEARYGIQLESNKPSFSPNSPFTKTAARVDEMAAKRARQYESDMDYTLSDGVIMVASDAHYWPGLVTAAHEAFCRLAKKLKPKAVVLNGDILDGARISRHPRAVWQKQPMLKDELAAVQDRLAEIARAANGADLIRTIGNHDARFENYLCQKAPELEEMTGSTLMDYLPDWRAGWCLHVNRQTNSWCTIRHRPVGGGIHSAYNSVLKSGVHYVHGHLHKLMVTPWSDYRGRRYGVDTGSLAEPYGAQFDYTEAGPVNWASGFVVLTYKDGLLLPPEMVVVDQGRAWFRGEEV